MTVELSTRLTGLSPKPSTRSILAGVTSTERCDKALIILLDGSSSMSSFMDNQRKIEVAWKVFQKDLVPNMAGWTYGIILFSTRANWLIYPVSTTTALVTMRTPVTTGTTTMGEALNMAWGWVESYAKEARFVLLSDGVPTDIGTSAIIDNARQHRTIPIDTVGIGSGTCDYNPDFLRTLSEVTGGMFTEAGTVKLLSEVIRKLSPAERPLLGTVKE